MSDSDRQPAIGWAIVEVMGHRVYAGQVSEQVVAGHAFVRVDVPAVDDAPAFTKLLGSGSIFCLTPVTEQVARAAARRHRVRPLAELGVDLTNRGALTAPIYDHDDRYDERD